jgi:hypothetical protein
VGVEEYKIFGLARKYSFREQSLIPGGDIIQRLLLRLRFLP